MKKNDEFSVRLRALRREKNMTQTQLGEKLGVSRSQVANWETGIRFPDRKDIENLSRFFGVPADYFYGTSDHQYKIDTCDYFEIDLSRLNNEGMYMLKEMYTLLIGSDKYTKS